MAVSSEYLTKIRRAVRRNTSVDVDAELTDIIEECRLDLQSVGVLASKATSETDNLILGAVRCFARWKFGLSNEDADKNKADYESLKSELMRKRDYIGYKVTFSATKDGVAEKDISITFDGETKLTDAGGTAVFYYISEGWHEYIADSVESDVEVTADTTVSVVV